MTTNERARTAYTEQARTTRRLLNEIFAVVDATEAASWGNVAELTDVNKKLQEAADFLLRRGEYAPEGEASDDSDNPVKARGFRSGMDFHEHADKTICWGNFCDVTREVSAR